MDVIVFLGGFAVGYVLGEVLHFIWGWFRARRR